MAFCPHGVLIQGDVRCEECCELTGDWDRDTPALPCTCKDEAKRWCDYGVNCVNVRRVGGRDDG